MRTHALATHPSREGLQVQRSQSAGLAFLERTEASILSPLRYPGSKRRLAGYVAHTLELNDLEPALFVEPFAGGASVALQLLNDGAVEEVGLADRDPLVAAFWKTVFWDTDWLCDQIANIPITLAGWRRHKRGLAKTRRQLALSCLYLNRTSFSGILAHDAGPIGGKLQKSPYKIDCRFPRTTLIRRVRQAGALRDRIAFVWECSWAQAIGRVRRLQATRGLSTERVFYYFDPPFFEKANSLYRHYFRPRDHRDFRSAALSLRNPWLISYDDSPMVAELYGSRARHLRVEQLYSPSAHAGQQRRTEVIITNVRAVPLATRLWRRSYEW